MFLLFPVLVFAQGRGTITGRVLSKGDKKPLVGASVYIDDKETEKIGTTTNADGRFILHIPKAVKEIVIS